MLSLHGGLAALTSETSSALSPPLASHLLMEQKGNMQNANTLAELRRTVRALEGAGRRPAAASSGQAALNAA